MIDSNDVYEKEDGEWVSRVIADEAVIVPLCRSDEDVRYIYSISNPTGMRIWQLLDGEHSVGHILEALKSEYHGQAEVVERDVLEFLSDLLEVQLIKNLQNKTKRSERKASLKRRGAGKRYEKPEITRIKMEAEQAVLSCCVNAVGSMKTWGANGNWCTYTCTFTNCVLITDTGHYKDAGSS